MGTDRTGSALPWVEAIAAAFPRRSFRGFHTEQLPELIERHGALVATDLVDAPPIAFRAEDGTSFTWHPAASGVHIEPGDGAAATVMELSEATFSEYLDALLTATGAHRTGRAQIACGNLAGWKRWEPAVRTLMTGVPIYGEHVWDSLVDADGHALELTRTFPADGDRDEMRHFLLTAGFLHVAGVYSPEATAAFGAEVEHVRSLTTPGDPYSWWSLNQDGEEVVTRINYLGRHSEALDELCFEPRLGELARLAGDDLRVCDDRLDGPMVFVKHAGVVKGNGDLVWHTDDGLGGHPVMCPLLQAGIQLDVASPANGQLLVLAGSHRYTKHWPTWDGVDGLPVVGIETQPGDVTLHFGDTLHATPAPTSPDAGRRALYYKFAEPKTFDWVPAGCHYNDALFRAEPDGRIASRATTY